MHIHVEIFQREYAFIPIELLFLWEVDPCIVEYLYNKWYTDPTGLIYISEIGIEIPYYIERIKRCTYRVGDIIRDILEKLYIRIYYTKGDNSDSALRLDAYAAICGVEYEKKRPYGDWPVASAADVKDI